MFAAAAKPVTVWALLATLRGAAGEQPASEAGAGGQLFLDGQAFPQDESSALDRLHGWLDQLHWSAGWEEGDTARQAYAQLEHYAAGITETPWLALGLGQAFLLYFWWRGTGLEVDIPAARLSALLHRVSIRFAGCEDPAMPQEAFHALQCSWRWRHAFMIPSELAVLLVRQRREVRLSAELLREANEVFALMRQLPHYSRLGFQTPYAVNTNAEFFPGPVNRPVWPAASVPFARFLEANAGVFRAELDAMLADGSFDRLYWGGEVSMTQFAPKHEGWAMVSILKNGKLQPRACAAANASCELLRDRPEVAHCTAGDAGAAFARLLPGHGLRPHFWNAPRLGAHLGLITPPGASMWVGGEEVTWAEGKVAVFDDTYIHSVLHEGTLPRYLLIAWFCHPCDRERAKLPLDEAEPLCAVQS